MSAARALLALLLAAGLAVSGAADAPSPDGKLSPELRFVLDRAGAARVGLEGFGGGGIDGARADEGRIGVLIRTSSQAALRARGLALGTVAGDVATARVTLEQLRAIRGWPEVVYVSGPGAARVHGAPRALPELDRARRLVGADELHRDGITGRGVVIGVVDTGVDWTHLDFRVDRDGDGREEGSRLLAIWDQTRPGARPAGFDYGAEYDREQIERALAGADEDLGPLIDASPSTPSHGTHVLGIAGGDGSSTELNDLVGMAPEAELVAVRSTMRHDEIVDAVRYVFDRAGARPAVANLSLGSHLGAHDGSSNFERALAALARAPGRVIVASAGNQGDETVHWGEFLPATAKTRATFDLPDPLPRSRFQFNVWYEPTGPLRVTVTDPDGNAFGPVATGEARRGDLPAGGVFVDNAAGGSNPNNGLHEILVQVYGKLFGSGNPLQPGRWTLELHAPGLGTRFDAWAIEVPFSSRNADADLTVTLPATAAEVIAVGAYVSRTEWASFEGGVERFTDDNPLGQIAGFSSRGPTRDGRIKPDLAAPGSMVASSLADGAAELVGLARILSDGFHFVNRGTSFAAPFASGAVALWLQDEPGLTATAALDRLRARAQRDAFTGFVAGNVWGAGKLHLSAPSGGATLAQALDADGSGRLDDVEILAAVRLWVRGQVVAGTGEPISDAAVLRLIELWILGTPVS